MFSLPTKEKDAAKAAAAAAAAADVVVVFAGDDSVDEGGVEAEAASESAICETSWSWSWSMYLMASRMTSSLETDCLRLMAGTRDFNRPNSTSVSLLIPDLLDFETQVVAEETWCWTPLRGSALLLLLLCSAVGEVGAEVLLTTMVVVDKHKFFGRTFFRPYGVCFRSGVRSCTDSSDCLRDGLRNAGGEEGIGD